MTFKLELKIEDRFPQQEDEVRSQLSEILAMTIKFVDLRTSVENLKKRADNDLVIHDMLLVKTYPALLEDTDVTKSRLEMLGDAICFSKEFDSLRVMPSETRSKLISLARKSRIAKALIGKQRLEEQTRAFDFVANEYRLRVVVPEEMVPMMVAKCGTAPEMEEIENEEK
jgi:hypothetical protein